MMTTFHGTLMEVVVVRDKKRKIKINPETLIGLTSSDEMYPTV